MRTVHLHGKMAHRLGTAMAAAAVFSVALTAAPDATAATTPAPAATATSVAAPAPAAAVSQQFKIGAYTAISLNDGALQEQNDGKSFVIGQPIAEVAKVLKSGGASGEHFDFDIHPLLVRTGKQVLLFDTGAGANFGPIAGKLLKSMAAGGVDPSTVTDIYISHAHGDHIGGLLTPSGALAFPNASIHMSAPEWKWLSTMKPEDAKNVGLPDVPSLVTAIKPKVVPFEPGATLLPGIVKAVEIKGHTPGHSGYEIGSGADSVLYIGDAMHSYVVSVQRPMWKVLYDNDQETGAASRVALVKRAAATGQRIFAVHFPFPGIGKIVKQNDSYVWVPEKT
jgi:glyoxylase-like metal-dependent hydrolase (beta-lactamase superfamily II)